MQYLVEQHNEVTAAIAHGRSLRDVLAVKWYVQELMSEHIQRFLPHPSAVLEVGCGGSLTLHLLSSRGHAVVGVDRDPRFVQYSETLGRALNSGASIIQANAFELPFPARSFDYVYSVGMVEHFDILDQRLLVAEMCRVSREYVHIEVPNPHPLSTFFAVARESAEVHLPCNPGALLVERNLELVDVDGRCVFDTLGLLKRNPALLAFAVSRASGILHDTYRAADIQLLCDAERNVSKLERLVYGFQLAWVGRLAEMAD
jgi:SAM-dependent methyltransferase